MLVIIAGLAVHLISFVRGGGISRLIRTAFGVRGDSRIGNAKLEREREREGGGLIPRC